MCLGGIKSFVFQESPLFGNQNHTSLSCEKFPFINSPGASLITKYIGCLLHIRVTSVKFVTPDKVLKFLC